MPAPRYSIVIPTRERPHTLEHTLATCLAQEGDFEVVVSDNWSGPRTRALVEERNDPRVRYVRTPSLLAMTDSLEFAVSHARGEYVIVQGDDDGLLRHALVTLDRILRTTAFAVLRWESAVYNWPDVSNPYFGPDALLVPLLQQRTGHPVLACGARRVIREVAAGQTHYSLLPVIYNSVIRRDVLDALRAKTGRVFKTRTPDVYSAFAVAGLVDTFHSLIAPLGLCGRSGASTGVARHFSKKGSPIDNEFRRLNEAAGLTLHPWVPDLPPIPSAVADAFLWAKADLFPDDSATALDRAQLIRDCLREVELDSAAEWREVQGACRQALADDADLLAWFDREYGRREWTAMPRPDRAEFRARRRYGMGHLQLDAAGFGVRNVDDAAALCERLLGYKLNGVEFYLDVAAEDVLPGQLEEKEAQIQYLFRECALLQKRFRDHDAELQQRLRAQDAHLQRQQAVLDEQQRQLAAFKSQGLSGVLRRVVNRLRPRRAA